MSRPQSFYLKIDEHVFESTAATARAWRILTGSSPASAVDTGMPLRLPPPQQQRYLSEVDPEWGYGRAIEWRSVEGSFESPGPAQV